MNQSNALPEGEVSLQSATQLTPTAVSAAGLRVSQAVLRFDRVAPGEESFRILKITPSQPDTAVTVVTDQPTDFQVAMGVEQLVFGSELTFTPELTGSYIHLRYKPLRAGQHRATLQVTAPQQQQTVVLTGRTTGLVGRLVTRTAQSDTTSGAMPLALPAPVQPAERHVLPTAHERQPISIGRLFLLFSIGISLLTVAYVYRCTLWPAGCQSRVVAPPADTVRRALPGPEPEAAEPAPTVRRRKRPAESVRAEATRTRTQTPAPRRADRSSSARREPVERAAAKRRQTAPANNTKRPSAPESDLERVLNRN